MVFVVAAVLHFIRLSFGIELNLGTWLVPVWLSGGVVVIAGILGVWSFKLLLNKEDNTVSASTKKELAPESNIMQSASDGEESSE